MGILNINKMSLGLEAIDFQSPEFADTITNYIDGLMKSKNGKEADKSDDFKNLVKALETKTGMKLNLTFNTEYPPCMMPVHINPNSILGDDFFKDYYSKDGNKIVKDLEKLNTGVIDLKNGKVSGIFSSVPVEIYMGFNCLKDTSLTSREIAAVLMHEVGHALVGFELTFNTIKTNQLLLAAHKAMVNNDQSQFEYVLKTAERHVGENSGVYTELKDEKDGKVVTVVLLAKFTEKIKSELGSEAYDFTTYEALADNYATRMGLGRDLVTGLESIMRAYGAPEYNSSTRIAINFSQTMSIVVMMCFGMLFTPVGSIILGALFFMLITWNSSTGSQSSNTYDILTVRYKRIREQLITYLKRRKIDPAESKKTIADIMLIDKIISETKDYTTMYGLIGNIMYPSNWGLAQKKNAQRKLEELASNDLYLKAAQLKGM